MKELNQSIDSKSISINQNPPPPFWSPPLPPTHSHSLTHLFAIILVISFFTYVRTYMRIRIIRTFVYVHISYVSICIILEQNYCNSGRPRPPNHSSPTQQEKKQKQTWHPLIYFWQPAPRARPAHATVCLLTLLLQQ